MQGLEDHYFRFTSYELFKGLPAQLVDEWSAWGVKAAVGCNSSSSVLKLLLLKTCCTRRTFESSLPKHRKATHAISLL